MKYICCLLAALACASAAPIPRDQVWEDEGGNIIAIATSDPPSNSRVESNQWVVSSPSDHRFPLFNDGENDDDDSDSDSDALLDPASFFPPGLCLVLNTVSDVFLLRHFVSYHDSLQFLSS
ncbi:hypothetical protein BCR43DRAFT_491070 [Syncephalastrum racemosum]|uniref:Secreted protein n=1 Tax=Syncephalastrum racemosum TaxID=13706 RepID=A0A1X2HGY6_SYNRA|nr:hypothetical protein BCR43DRAFT_491070 [Syncephalastrum racemosum]